MDFTLPPHIEDYRKRYRAFVAEHLLPLEQDPRAYDDHENIRLDVLEKMRVKAKAAGLWAPQMPKERGGQGLNVVGMAACYEEANYSIFGPVTFNCAAPDDGDMIVLNKIGTEEQKKRWLQPIIDGKVRSAIVMTEPAPGAGSDPAMMLTTAEKKAGKWVIRGRKWFITGAGVAQHFILIAKTSDDKRKGLTAFMFDRDQPGWSIVRRIPIMGPEEHGGHCELEFDGLEIPDENRLMNVGDGLKVAQIRLGTARLTHCMRWLGLARRSMDIAAEYVARRDAHGSKLAERESVQWLLGEAAMQIEIGRLLVMRAAAKLDRGDFARKEISAAKIAVADVLHKAADTAIQLNGARGYSKDTILEWIYRYARQARLVDGASEVHRMVLARFYMQERNDFWSWG
ncbi:MAG: acyl-CoA dehydrogenase [Betaproteobacteria bacterium RIFCSPLOWO2_12_FULL_68_19]|nr:MAG: acyl-CoA dehydrogenase [Betaproteobacteria bacterium RIFCSPLOWO2_12_FULL_68_19]